MKVGMFPHTALTLTRMLTRDESGMHTSDYKLKMIGNRPKQAKPLTMHRGARND